MTLSKDNVDAVVFVLCFVGLIGGIAAILAFFIWAVQAAT